MKIFVAVKRVVDANVKVRVKSDGTGMELANAKMAMNPFCEIAVEQAVRMKEAGQADEIVAVSIGPQVCQEQLRTALALGCDRGILVTAESDVAPLQVARILKALAEREAPDLIILGKQSIDSDNNQVGQMLAAIAGMGQGTFACKAELAPDRTNGSTKGRIVVTREIDGGEQTVSLKLPAVVTTDLRLNEPRYASLPNIMKAKRKPIDQLTPTDLGVDTASGLKTLQVLSPAEREAGIIVETVDDLVGKLKSEARVI